MVRRRPSAEPPPLPHDLRRSGWVLATLTGAVIVFWLLLFVTGLRPRADSFDEAVLRRIARLRSEWLTDVARAVQPLGYDQTIVVLQAGLLAVALAFRRFRHGLVFGGSILFTIWLTSTMAVLVARPRPHTVPIMGAWKGFSYPSRPVAAVALTLVGAIYMLVPHGRWRIQRGADAASTAARRTSPATWLCAAVLAAFAFTRLYLGVDHPTDIVFGAIIGVGVPLVAFRVLTPPEIFPITYRRRQTAHLDVGGRRGEAMRRALMEQLGLDVVELTPFGLEGSAGSTPVLIRVAGEERALFGKLYAATHLRSDRWYKLGRALVYGRLEDEASFSTVRRLVQYEDYMLRLMQAAELPTAAPYGFVEITPEREYLLVCEFFDNAREIGDTDVDESVIDDALQVVRALWDAGLAHRDIKPSNVLVQNGRVLLVDVAFAEARPSPWRQAVDLANMLLVLALRSDPELVYARAQQVFSSDELGEAFAAAHGVAVPGQLRARLRQDGRDLLGRFRALAPPYPPIRIQRWSLRRVGLMASVAAAVVVGAFGVAYAIGIVQLV